MSLRAFAVGFVCFSFAALPAAAQQNTATQGSSQGSIEGHTLSLDGQPLRKTNLILRPIPVFNGGRGGAGAGAMGPVQMPTPYGTTSDASGKFAFTGLEPGRYTLSAEHAGYLSAQYGTKRIGGGMQTGNPIINLTAGQHVTEINVQLAPQAVISGRVTDQDGDPMPQVRVTGMRRMYGPGGSRLANTGGGSSTDENGDYHLTNLTPGRYYLSFTPVRMGMFENTRRAGGDASAPEMGYGSTYYPGSADLQGAVAVDVAEGEEKNGMNLQIHQVPVYHIRGKLTGDLPPVEPGARPMAGRIQISATPPGGGMFGMNMQMVKPDGTFDISGLTPGTWTITAMRMQGQMQTVGRSTVVISNQDVGDLDLAAKGGVDISGVVKIVPENATVAPQSSASQNSGQNPGQGRGAAQVARVRAVQLQSDDGFVVGGNVQPAQVQADGSFKFTSVPPLRFRVDAGVPQGGYLKSATLNGQDAMQQAVDMSSGGTLQLVVSMTAAEVDGTVTGADGQPATDAMITLTPDPLQPERRDLYHQARTRADGGFTMKGLAPGKYRVFAWEEIEQGAFFDPDYMHPFESLGTQISVDDNDKKTVTLQEITKDKAADVNRRAGH